MTREKILAEVTAERAAQDATWGGADHDDTHSRSEWVAILARHVGLCVDDGYPNRSEDARWRRELVRIAAVAVAAIESHDRLSLLVWQRESDRLGETLLLLDTRFRHPTASVEPCGLYAVTLGAATPWEFANFTARIEPRAKT